MFPYNLKDMPKNNTIDLRWIWRRFGRTVGVYQDRLVYIQEIGEDGVYIEDAGGGGMVSIPYEEADIQLGVPPHGWVNDDSGSPLLLRRSFYNKWKLGWQPGEDTIGNHWQLLAKPRHKPISEITTHGAINSLYAIRNRELYYHDDGNNPIGHLVTGNQEEKYIQVPTENDWVAFDNRLTDLVGVVVRDNDQ